MKNMSPRDPRISFICVLHKTPQIHISRLKQEIPSLLAIDNSSNRKGYAWGINQGIRQGLAMNNDIFVIMNPDISISGFDKKAFLNVIHRFDIGGFAMRQEKRVYYGGKIDKWRMSGGLMTRKPRKRFVPVDFVSGSLMVVKKEVIEKIGLFEEKYFMYYEDVEYCERGRRAGFTVGIDSQLIYEHFEDSRFNKKKHYYLWRNRLWFLFEYGSLSQKIYEIIRLPKTLYEYFS